MGVYAGIEKNWAALTDTGRTHVATKGVVQSGLVLNLDAGVSSSYSGSGTTWTDLSGNGNTGTLVNGVGYNGDNGGSLSFDGVNDFVNQPSPSLNLSNFTIVAWKKGSGVVIGSGRNEGWPRFWRMNHNSFQFKPVSINGQYIVYSLNIPNTNNSIWEMICFTRSGSLLTAYKDGVSVASNASFPTNALVTFSDWGQFIGRVKYDVPGYISESFFTGNIAQVSIYNRALSASEISQNFNALRGRFGI